MTIGNLLGFLALFMSVAAAAQSSRTTAQQPVAVNQRDAQGKPHGVWYQATESVRGESAYREVGTYDHGRRTGAWTRMDENGDLLAVERYRNNVLDGESKYYERGRLAIVGNYRGLNPDHAFDTLYVMDPISGAEKPVVVATERGSLRHGLWRYYDPERGRLLREEEYQVDELIRHKEFAVAGSDSARLNARIRQLPHVHNPRAQAPAYNSQLGY